eukprot:TRINITY_DN1970_c0_g1_i2.p1 TRINITY_DN1970_c0_g1~~TRINITY_DN1970_c0_g1_i2.p1  ORF type:complete len:630 (+),score=128.03 TRINITY_DN1970_c0_g1_i2:30-1919(+)
MNNNPQLLKAKEITDEYVKSLEDQVIFLDKVDFFLSSEADPKKKKHSPKYLAITKYQILVVQSKIEKEFHILNLEEIGGSKGNIVLTFSGNLAHSEGISPQQSPFAKSKQHYLFIQSERTEAICFELQRLYILVTFGKPAKERLRVNCQGIRVVDNNYDVGPCKGLLNSYLAYCNFYLQSPHRELIELIKQHDKFNEENFDFSKVIGADEDLEATPSSTSADILCNTYTLAEALKYNTHFKHFISHNAQQRNLSDLLSIIMSKNTTLRSIMCHNNHTEVSEDFGNSLYSNQDNRLEVLQFSSEKITSSGALSLSRSFTKFEHSLKVFDISYCNISTSGLYSIFQSFRKNWKVSLGLEELNVSGNSFNDQSYDALLSFLRDGRKHMNLRRLSVADVDVSVASLLLELTVLPVEYLDISINKLEKNISESLGHFAQVNRSIQVLKMSKMKLSSGFPFESFSRSLKHIFDSDMAKAEGFHLDISYNQLSSSSSSSSSSSTPSMGFQVVTQFFLSGHLKSLHITDCDLGEMGVINLLQCLGPTIERLVVDRNFSGVYVQGTMYAGAHLTTTTTTADSSGNSSTVNLKEEYRRMVRPNHTLNLIHPFVTSSPSSPSSPSSLSSLIILLISSCLG